MTLVEHVHTIELPSGASSDIQRWRFGPSDGIRASIIAGIRGDTPEGMRVAFDLIRSLREIEERLLGQVDVYPCVNPLAAEQGRKLWPFFEVDLNRTFPGHENGHPPARLAHTLVQSVTGSNCVIEVRGARPAFRECPQALIREGDPESLSLAEAANVKIVWRRTLGPAAPSTFAYQFPHTLVLEGGAGNRLTNSVGKILHDGILNVLGRMGFLEDKDLPFHWATIDRPRVVGDDRVLRIRAESSGLFLPAVDPDEILTEGQIIGRIIHPDTGEVREHIVAPDHAYVMAIREHPVIGVGMMVARLVKIPGEIK